MGKQSAAKIPVLNLSIRCLYIRISLARYVRGVDGLQKTGAIPIQGQLKLRSLISLAPQVISHGKKPPLRQQTPLLLILVEQKNVVAVEQFDTKGLSL
jgi:hypothetical protein